MFQRTKKLGPAHSYIGVAWVARSETIMHTRVTGAVATDSLDRFRCVVFCEES